jgi:hypothetical protein
MALIMINPTSSWFKIMELPVVHWLKRQTANGKELLTANKVFDKSSGCIAKLINKTRLWRYPRCHHLIYNNRSEFKLPFKYLCKSYGIMHKPTTVKNPQANAILERVQQVLGQMLHPADSQISYPWWRLCLPLTTQHGKFALHIIQYLKSHQVQLILDTTCSLIFHL